jgi:phage terminase large subunit-like protein
MDPAQVLALAREKLRRESRTVLLRYKPYAFQFKFHESCREYQQVLLMAGNRVGKTRCGAAEMAYHLTGRYPEWWTGRRFDRPVRAWACGTTYEKVKKILQSALLGDPENPAAFGTGMVPGDDIIATIRKPGVPLALAGFSVRHVTGGVSVCDFKAYEAGAEAFMGESIDFIWLDEEPSMEIFTQAVTRVLDRKGFVYMTFTPESGMTELVAGFWTERKPGQVLLTATWDDAPHLDAKAREQALAIYPAHERDMRSKGLPQFGSGHPTAAAWCALDPETGTFYVYDAYKEAKQTIPVHASAVKSRGIDIPVAWPHDGQKHDSGSGEGLADLYRKEGVRMLPTHSTNPPGPGQKEGEGGIAVEPGIQAMLTAMQQGKFKVFRHLSSWLQEFRMYHRKDGVIVKLNDDLMAATRYAFQMRRYAKTRVVRRRPEKAVVDISLEVADGF